MPRLSRTATAEALSKKGPEDDGEERDSQGRIVFDVRAHYERAIRESEQMDEVEASEGMRRMRERWNRL